MKQFNLLLCVPILAAMGAFAPAQAQYQLQILHASDLEGGVEAIDRAPLFAAIVDDLEETYPNTIILSAGDNYIPGPFFSASSDPAVRPVLQAFYSDYFGIGANDFREGVGRIDITIMNAIGFDASALGNHEFDAGTNTIAEIIGTQFSGPNVRWAGSQFPYLSANLNFSGDGALSGLFQNTIENNTFFEYGPPFSGPKKSIAPATLIERGGEVIGVVGATTPLLASISSPGNTTIENPGAGTNNMADLASILQPVIDDMISAGVNKIVLVSHLQQIALEEELATLLSGVDVIIAGGSDAVLANPSSDLLPEDVGNVYADYPVQTTNADGDPVVIVSTNGEYSYVGRLVVSFDAMGVLDLSSITDESGPYVATEAKVTELWGNLADAFAPGTKGEAVENLTDAVRDIVIAKDGNVFGSTAVFLEGQRSAVRTEETNLGNFTADANLWFAKQIDPTVSVSIKNGGGIRAAIGEVVDLGGGNFEFLPPQANPLSGKNTGEISQLDIENSMRFNNALTLVTVTAEELLAILEHGVAAWSPTSTPGQFAQVGGVRFSFDPSLPSNNRVINAAIIDEDGDLVEVLVQNGDVVGDPTRTFRMVSLSFLVDGGDSYPIPETDRLDLVGNVPAEIVNAGVANFTAAGTEQDAFAEYTAALFSTEPFAQPETPKSQDSRIQNLAFRADNVLDEPCDTWNYYLSNVNADFTSDIYRVELDPLSGEANLIWLKSLDYEVHIAYDAEEALLYLVRSQGGSFRTLDVSVVDGALSAETLIDATLTKVTAAVINQDGKLIIGDTNNDQILLVDVNDGSTSSFATGPVSGGDIAIGLDGTPYLATRTGGILFQINPGFGTVMLGNVSQVVTGLAVMDSGDLLYSSFQSSLLTGRDALGMPNGMSFELKLDGETFVHFNGDLASGCGDNLEVIDQCDYKLYYAHQPQGGSYSLIEVSLNDNGTTTLNTLLSGLGSTHIALSPDGSTIYMVGTGNTLSIYDVALGTIVSSVPMQTAGGMNVSNAPAAVVGQDGTLYVATGNKVYTVDPATGLAVQFGPNRAVNGGDLIFAPTGEEGAEELWIITRNNNRFTNVLTGDFFTVDVNEINGAAVLENGNVLLSDGNGEGLFKEVNLSTLDIVATYETGLALFNGDLAGGCTASDNLEVPEPGLCAAAEVISYMEGTKSNGSPIAANRVDATQALGEPQGTDAMVFVTLGYGGSIVLGFDGAVPNEAGADLEIVETSFGNPGCAAYPEFADVYVSQNGVDFFFAKTVCKSDNLVDIDDAGEGFDYITYVKIANNDELTSTPDGFDVDGVRAIHNCEAGEEEEQGFALVADQEVNLTSQPNPTTGPSTVVFTAPEAGRYMLEVYDMSGRSVATIFNRDVDANVAYRVDFDGSALPNGVYIYRLTGAGKTEISKLMIAR